MPSTGFAVVGERGPEVVKLPGGSQVYPNGQAPAQSSQQSRGGNTINQSVIVQAQTNASPRQIAGEIGWQLRLMG
jgi:hypothetical protein